MFSCQPLKSPLVDHYTKWLLSLENLTHAFWLEAISRYFQTISEGYFWVEQRKENHTFDSKPSVCYIEHSCNTPELRWLMSCTSGTDKGFKEHAEHWYVFQSPLISVRSSASWITLTERCRNVSWHISARLWIRSPFPVPTPNTEPPDPIEHTYAHTHTHKQTKPASFWFSSPLFCSY